MALYLVRHAHAGSRKAWKGDDLERPLDDRGTRQAKGLLTLVPVDLAMVLSSPSRRCVQTVDPLAERAGVAVGTDSGLFEAADPEPIATRLRDLLQNVHKDLVACSHGDLIPDLLELWAGAGAALDLGQKSAKGSVWALQADRRGRILSGTYAPPTELRSRQAGWAPWAIHRSFKAFWHLTIQMMKPTKGSRIHAPVAAVTGGS